MRPPKLLNLPKKGKEKLEALLCSERDARQWRTYKAILLCCEKSRKEVAGILGMTERNVGVLACNFQEGGIDSLKIIKQSGRPSKIPKKKQERIVSIIDNNAHGWSTKQIQKLIYDKSGVKYSERQIYRISQKWGFSEVTPRPRSIRRASISTVYRFKKSRKGNR